MRVILLSCAGAPFSAEILQALAAARPELLKCFCAAVLSLPYRSPLAGLPKHKQIAVVFKQKGLRGLVNEIRLALTHRMHALKSRLPLWKSGFGTAPLRIEGFCDAHGIPYRYTRDINEAESIAILRSFEPDIVLVATFNHILKREAIAIARLATLNIHPSYLPRYRGADPIAAVLRDRATETGVSIHWIDEGIDTGDIVYRQEMPIRRGSDNASLRAELAQAAARLVIRLLDNTLSGGIPRLAQER